MGTRAKIMRAGKDVTITAFSFMGGQALAAGMLGLDQAIYGERPKVEIVAEADLKGPVAAFEVFIEAPPLPKQKATKARAKLTLSPFQPVERDFAFLVDAAVEAEKLVRAARNADKALIAGARVFDVYAGKGVPDGKKSLAIAVTLQPMERTLTDAEIEAVSNKIVAAVAKATGATLRG